MTTTMETRRCDDTALVSALVDALGDNVVLDAPVELELHAGDASLLQRVRPAVVCMPETRAHVQACVAIGRRFGRTIVPRGAGTSLTGAAVPLPGAVVVCTTRMRRILDVDVDRRMAWVEPGAVNGHLAGAVAEHDLEFAPDPASRSVCTVGGNVATNAGGPKTLAYGNTSPHVLGIEVVLADGSVQMLGGVEPEPAGYDLRGAFVGSEGTLGISTRIAVRLIRRPAAVETLLAAFPSIAAAAAFVRATLAEGVVPVGFELMDQTIVRAVEAHLSIGLPEDAAAVVLAEVAGLPASVRRQRQVVTDVACACDGTIAIRAADEHERDQLWLARRSAGGALARLAPNHYLHDAVVPRSKLAAAFNRIREIAGERGVEVANLCHAGDGNLHPLVLFDAADASSRERAIDSSESILRACIDLGGVLTGEHGVGLEKRDLMHLMYDDDDLDQQRLLRQAFDPTDTFNTGKVLPGPAACIDWWNEPEPAAVPRVAPEPVS